MSMGLDENLEDMEHTMMKKPWVLVLKESAQAAMTNYTDSRA